MIKKLFQRLFAKKPVVRISHPTFGEMTFELGIWSGHATSGARRIPFIVDGPEAGPDPCKLAAVERLLADFDAYEQEALAYLDAHDPDVDVRGLHFYCLDMHSDDEPREFVMEFAAEGGVDGVWRVEFENGKPSMVGFDD